MSPFDLQDHIRELHEERALALVEGLGDNATYLADLDEEIAVSRAMFVRAAVVEIATLRAALGSPLQG